MAFAALVGLVGAAVGFIVVVVPLFGLARALEAGRGLGRPVIRDNLLRWSLPAAVIAGLVSGAIAGRWYRSGGRIPWE